MNDWVDTSTGLPIEGDWTASCGCAPPAVNVTQVQKTLTLYYKAYSGQVDFPLSVFDLYSNNYLLTASSALAVTRNGSRLMPDNGAGVGGYIVNVSTNTVSLLWPAGDGEIILVDLFWEAEQAAAPPSLAQAIGQDYLAITSLNVIPPLSRPADGFVLILYVDGHPFFAGGASPAFTVAGNIVTWTSTLFSVPVGAEVVALYTSYGNPPSPPPWWLSLPTTLPPTAGVLWNNAGVVSVSVAS